MPPEPPQPEGSPFLPPAPSAPASPPRAGPGEESPSKVLQRHAEAALLRRAKTLSFVIIALLVVTAIGYTVYAATGIGESQSVFTKVQNGYNTTVTTTNANGTTTTSSQTLRPANNTTSPVGSLPIAPYFGFLKWSLLVDLAIVWFLVVFTIFSVLRPSNLRDPSKLLDIFYLNLLFGVVFWPLAALGSYFGTWAPAVMLPLGMIPAVVLTVFVARFIEEGTGGTLVFLIVLFSMGAVMALNAILWGAVLTGGNLALVIVLQFLPAVLYFGWAWFDKVEPIKNRPIVAELLMWGGIGVILSAAVGVGVTQSFGSATFDVLTVSSLFTGSTDLVAPQIAPWTFINGVSSTPFGVFVASYLPIIFGLTGLATAVMSIPPLLAVGDFLTIRSGSSVADQCRRCNKPFIAVRSQATGYCQRCRVRPEVIRKLRQGSSPAPAATAPTSVI